MSGNSIESIIEHTKNWMKRYNKSKLIKWIQICSIHPTNQLYQGRFELLLAISLSIKEKEFEKKTLDYDAFRRFIKEFEIKSNRFFIEDFIPYSQLNLIPYFIDGIKYYFFYGHLENAYESLRILDKVFLFDSSEKIPELDLIKNIFLRLLKIDTEILLKLNFNPESHTKSKDNIFAPSEDYFQSLITLFDVKSSEISTTNHFQEYIEEDFIVKNVSKFTYGGFFEKLYIKISDYEVLLLLPQLHIEIFPSVFRDIIQKSPNNYYIKGKINENFTRQVHRAFNKFFKKPIYEITDAENTSLSVKTDGIFQFENKLIALKIPLIFPESDLSDEINRSYLALEEFREKIEKQEFINLKFHPEYFHKVPTKDIEILKFIVYEKIDINPILLTLDIAKKLKYNLFSFQDLIAMLEIISSPLSFIKYLEERHKYRQKIRTINGLNIFAAFIQNGDSIPDYGGDFMTIMPHTWSDFYYKHLFLKFQDNIYELIESDYPDKFDYVKQIEISQNLYECFSTELLEGAQLIKFEDKLIWIFSPEQHPSLSLNDYRFAMSMFGLLYSDYINRIRKKFLILLQSNNFNEKIRIYLVPYPLFQSNNRYLKYSDTYKKINEDSPLVVRSFIDMEKNLISLVFYDTELWMKKFYTTIANENCKFAIKQLLLSIIHTLNEKLSSEKIIRIANEILEIIPICKKDYFLTSLIARNPRGNDYGPYAQISSTDVNQVIKEIEATFRNQGLRNKKFSPEESKGLYNKIFENFYSKLEKLVSNYDISLILFAYKQLELIERSRFEQIIEMGMKNSEQLTAADRERNANERIEITKHSSSASFIIEMVLKCGIIGKSKINLIDWSYIQALAAYLLMISERSEFTHTKLIDFYIQITDNNKFDEIQQPGIFDYNSYTEKRFDIGLERAKDIFMSLKEQSEKIVGDEILIEIPDYEKKLFDELDAAFRSQFSFSFTNLLRVLSILSSTDLHSNDYNLFPLTIINETDMIIEIKKRYLEGFAINYLKEETITDEEVQIILNFISIDFESYSEIEMLIPIKLLKKKERLTISPLVRIENLIIYGNECCNIALGLWKHNVISGIFPFVLPINSKVDTAIKKIHSYEDKIFEEECGKIAVDVLGENNYLFRLKNFKRISDTFPKYPPCGEIDLLAINKDTKKIFILDSKNYFFRILPKDIKNEIHRFIENRKSDLKKLTKKENFVKDNIDKFLDYFNISNKNNWKTIKGFIIRQNLPSAHIKEISENFIFIEDLQKYFES